MPPKFLWPTLPLKVINKNLFVWGFGGFILFFFLVPEMFQICILQAIASRTLRNWCSCSCMPCELNKGMILLPESVAGFHVARSTHTSRVWCRLSVLLAPRAKLCKSTHGNLAARRIVQAHLSVFFLGPGMQLCTLVWFSQHFCLCWSALCYPCVPDATADTCLLLCWHFTCTTGTCSWGVPRCCWMGFC